MNGLLISMSEGIHAHLLCSLGAFETIRVIPPLNVSAADLQQGIELLGRSLDQVLGPLAK